MIDLLRERFKANGFTDQRMKDAVAFVIDSYTGFDKLPAIGDFIKFDKKVKVFTLSELQFKHKDSYYFGAKYDPIAEEYTRVIVNGEIRYAKKDEAIKYRMEIYTPQPTIIPFQPKEEVITDGQEMLVEELKNNLSAKPEVKKLSKEERALRNKKFQEILESENGKAEN